MPKNTSISERNTAKKEPEMAVVPDPKPCITLFSLQEKTSCITRDLGRC